MKIRFPFVLMLVASGLIVASGCAADGEPAANDPELVTGVVVEIESHGLGEVESFTLKDGDATYEVFIADDVDYDFPLGHLSEHRVGADPITVRLERRSDDRLYALSIDDAS